jgi:predicted acetyltransferase
MNRGGKIKQMPQNLLELPRSLGSGLVMRYTTPEDAEELARFNATHLEDEHDPPGIVANWMRDLLKGVHPTYRASDFLVVIDQNAGGKIVSSVGLFSQEWAYQDIPFKFGQPELVATDPAYRCKGLIRQQFEVIHAMSAARGELVQGITGIPWYYRQFGYEMTLNLDGFRRLYWVNVGKLAKDEQETYQMRPATVEDIPLLAQLYAISCASSLFKRLRSEKDWYYAVTMPGIKTPGFSKQCQVIETLSGEPIGYAVYRLIATAKRFVCQEFAVLPGQNLRMVAEFFLRQIKSQAEELNKALDEPYTGISFKLSDNHPLYEALGQQWEREVKSDTWYIRVPDLAAFIRHITPALQRRLVGSVMEGYSGVFKLNFYRDKLALTFDKGQLTGIGTYETTGVEDGDVLFPGLTFLHVLFGHRSLEELNYIYPDCRVNSERARVLLGILFPKQPSQVVLLN